MPVAIVLTLAWGAIPFGAVYPWAYWPLAAACATLGGWGLAGRAKADRNRVWASSPLWVGLLVLVLAVGVQLMPLPARVLARLSPSTDSFLRGYDLAYAVPWPSPALSAFGPFINRNHFAGWMLMALPLALAYFAELVASGTRGGKPGFRDRVLWFASPDANRAILVQFAILVMGLSLVKTISRSGITCFAVTLVLVASGLALALKGLSVWRIR